MGKILGIDFGTKNIGLAISDSTHDFSTPLTTLQKKRGRSEAKTVAEYIAGQKLELDRLVIGNPLGIAGKPTKLSGLTVRFAEELSTLCGISYSLWEETGTSQLATQLNGQRDNHAKAAQIILQEYLDFRRTGI